MELVNVNGVQIAKDVKDAIDKFNKEKISQLQANAQLTVKTNGGYMSKYDIAQELLNYVDPSLIQDTKKKDLVTKAKESKNFLTEIASDAAQFNTLETVLNSLGKGYYKAGGQSIMLMQQPKNHKHISSGILYGIPNQTTLDPRRTGKIVVFNDISNELYLKMLKEGPAYGFIWYGPVDRNVWFYLGDAAKSIIVI